MARNVSIANLIARIQARADLENDERVTGDKIQVLLSEMNGELQLLVAETGMRYFETEATITASGAASYALPGDHLSTIGLEFVLDAAGTRRKLAEIMIQERTSLTGRTGDGYYYAIAGQNLILYPNPASGSYKHLYIPQPPDISASLSSTNVDVITPDGEAFLIWGCVVKALGSGEVDVRLAMQERDEARERLRNWAQLRSFITPRRHVLGYDPTTGQDPGLGRDPGDWWPRG